MPSFTYIWILYIENLEVERDDILMICSRKDLLEYIQADALASGRCTVKPKLFGDEIWKFQLTLRKFEYYSNKKGISRYITMLQKIFYHFQFHKISVRLGYSIPINVFDKGLCIAHIGGIVVNNTAKVGKNCKILEGVNIGATNGINKAATIGNNVFISTGAKIIGDITIANDVVIGANAVVVKSITESGTTWGGVPARKISNNDSHLNLNKDIFM